MTHKETQGILAWLYLQTSDLDETDGEYFDDKHNNALKVVERISNKLKIIFTMLSLLSQEAY